MKSNWTLVFSIALLAFTVACEDEVMTPADPPSIEPLDTIPDPIDSTQIRISEQRGYTDGQLQYRREFYYDGTQLDVQRRYEYQAGIVQDSSIFEYEYIGEEVHVTRRNAVNGAWEFLQREEHDFSNALLLEYRVFEERNGAEVMYHQRVMEYDNGQYTSITFYQDTGNGLEFQTTKTFHYEAERVDSTSSVFINGQGELVDDFYQQLIYEGDDLVEVLGYIPNGIGDEDGVYSRQVKTLGPFGVIQSMQYNYQFDSEELVLGVTTSYEYGVEGELISRENIFEQISSTNLDEYIYEPGEGNYSDITWTPERVVFQGVGIP